MVTYRLRLIIPRICLLAIRGCSEKLLGIAQFVWRKLPQFEMDEASRYECLLLIEDLFAEMCIRDRIFIHFGAVKSAFFLYINGKRVGYSQAVSYTHLF